MALKQITAQDFKEAVDSLNNGYTCWHKLLGRTDAGTELVFVIGWSDAGYDEDDAKKNGYADGSYTICSKIACQSRYNGSQSDYDGDFEMPYDKETGDVWDTDTMVSNNESDWEADAATYNKDAQDIWDTYCVPNEDGFTALDALFESKKKPESKQSKKSERWVPGTAFDYDEYNYFVRLFSGFLSKKGIANTITGGLKRKISVPSLTINGKTFDNVQFILNLAPNYALPFGFVMVADGLAYDFGDVMDPGKDPMGRDTLKGVNEYVFDSLLNGDYPLSCLGDAKKLKVVKESADNKSKGCSMKRKIESLAKRKAVKKSEAISASSIRVDPYDIAVKVQEVNTYKSTSGASLTAEVPAVEAWFNDLSEFKDCVDGLAENCNGYADISRDGSDILVQINAPKDDESGDYEVIVELRCSTEITHASLEGVVDLLNNA